MTDLTEQWKKGELPEGHYYIKTGSETNIDEYIQWYKDHGIPSEKSFAYFNVQQVLAPVPSYEEWEEKNETAYILAKGITERNEKIDQLKELLKECVEVLNDAQRNYGYDDSIIDICYPIITKIDEALR